MEFADTASVGSTANITVVVRAPGDVNADFDFDFYDLVRFVDATALDVKTLNVTSTATLMEIST